MKRAIVLLLVLCFTYSCCFGINSAFQKISQASSGRIYSKFTVVLDAGHGGKDSGTIAQDGTLEKDINLAILLLMNDYLRVMGINTRPTRITDEEMYKNGESRNKSDLYNRLDFINSTNNALMVSIHQNHFTDESEWGMQTWYAPNSESSKKLADSIQYVNTLLLNNDNNRQNKESDNSYYILYKATVPSVMVECGFMSNYAENERLKSNEYQNNLAFCNSLGILDYINGDI